MAGSGEQYMTSTIIARVYNRARAPASTNCSVALDSSGVLIIAVRKIPAYSDAEGRTVVVRHARDNFWVKGCSCIEN